MAENKEAVIQDDEIDELGELDEQDEEIDVHTSRDEITIKVKNPAPGTRSALLSALGMSGGISESSSGSRTRDVSVEELVAIAKIRYRTEITQGKPISVGMIKRIPGAGSEKAMKVRDALAAEKNGKAAAS